jgi:hypothetical protein
MIWLSAGVGARSVIATDCALHYPGGVDVVGLDAMIAGWQNFFPKLKETKCSYSSVRR